MPHTAWPHAMAHAFAMSHHPVTMLSGKAPLVLNDRPDLFISELIAEPDHRGAGRAVLDHPEDLAFRDRKSTRLNSSHT